MRGLGHVLTEFLSMRTRGRAGGRGSSGRSYRQDKTPRKSRGRTASSRRWIERQLNDPFVTEAKARGLRSRAGLKLEQIDKKHGLFFLGAKVLDLGCAPGGWLQYAAGRIGLSEGKGKLVGVDLLKTEAIGGADILVGDINDDGVLEEVMRLMEGRADIVLSDMAADTTGHRATDHLRTTALLEIALDMGLRLLNPGGVFLGKCFRGGAERGALEVMRLNFESVRHVKPPASRQESVESYVLATGFRGDNDSSDSASDSA